MTCDWCSKEMRDPGATIHSEYGPHSDQRICGECLDTHEGRDWILVSDQLPDPDTDVLAIVDWYGEQTRALGTWSAHDGWYAVSTMISFQDNHATPVTHWQSLPELP